MVSLLGGKFRYGTHGFPKSDIVWWLLSGLADDEVMKPQFRSRRSTNLERDFAGPVPQGPVPTRDPSVPFRSPRPADLGKSDCPEVHGCQRYLSTAPKGPTLAHVCRP